MYGVDIFEFRYKHEYMVFEGVTLSQAMNEANEMTGAKPEGVWYESKPGKYKWVEGNFFD